MSPLSLSMYQPTSNQLNALALSPRLRRHRKPKSAPPPVSKLGPLVEMEEPELEPAPKCAERLGNKRVTQKKRHTHRRSFSEPLKISASLGARPCLEEVKTDLQPGFD